MCYHPKCREWHAPDHQARATVGQTSLLKAERARQNRAYVRKLLQERQPEFAAALAAVERSFSCAACPGERDQDDDRASHDCALA